MSIGRGFDLYSLQSLQIGLRQPKLLVVGPYSWPSTADLSGLSHLETLKETFAKQLGYCQGRPVRSFAPIIRDPEHANPEDTTDPD
jgi:hypothetical protein